MTDAQEPRTPTIAAQIEALAPCPVCGAQPIWRTTPSIFRLQCLNDVHLFQAYGPSKEACIANWNTRPAIVTALRRAEGEYSYEVLKLGHEMSHEAATSMGYPSVTEALEHLSELRAAPPSADAAMVEALEGAQSYVTWFRDNHCKKGDASWEDAGYLNRQIDAALASRQPVGVDTAAEAARLLAGHAQSNGYDRFKWKGFIKTGDEHTERFIVEVSFPVEAVAQERPVPMILHCPECHLQHIDEPDERTPEWDNPPHRSHLCHGCGCIWRPADVPTEGVRYTWTRGKADTWLPAAPATDEGEAGNVEG